MLFGAWDGLGWDGDGPEWVGMEWDGIGEDGMGWHGMADVRTGAHLLLSYTPPSTARGDRASVIFPSCRMRDPISMKLFCFFFIMVPPHGPQTVGLSKHICLSYPRLL